ncbi:MAG: PilZ domain-containing protein [Pyrinomonadaceae bacterium]|nr:PilZ domain-containing protein [Pyrinomonadaceae bacterium]
MPRQIEADNRTGPRYLTSLIVQAEWDREDGAHVVAEGTTENVGPEGALVHLQRELPDVGSRVQLSVLGEEGRKLKVITEVLRLERNAAHPLAALQLLDATDEWRGLVWEPAAPRAREQPVELDEEVEEEDEVEH